MLDQHSQLELANITIGIPITRSFRSELQNARLDCLLLLCSHLTPKSLDPVPASFLKHSYNGHLVLSRIKSLYSSMRALCDSFELWLHPISSFAWLSIDFHMTTESFLGRTRRGVKFLSNCLLRCQAVLKTLDVCARRNCKLSSLLVIQSDLAAKPKTSRRSQWNVSRAATFSSWGEQESART